jgi:hypothetical protein
MARTAHTARAAASKSTDGVSDPHHDAHHEPRSAALSEVLSFPAELLGELPVATRFELQGLGIATPIVWTTESNARAGADPFGIVFDAEEVRALAIGVQAERLWAADLKGFCLRKLHDPSFRVNALVALGGAQPLAGRPWSLGRVLRWFDLELTRIDFATCDSEVPHAGAAAA